MIDNKKIRSIFSTVFSIFMLVILFIFYGRYNYNFFYKGISESGKTSFVRDNDVKYENRKSYRVENKDYTDSMFYREISVLPNCSYRVSCMVKTQNVEQYEGNQVAGAQIVLKGTEEHSEVISGTQDWTKIELRFNSKNNNKVEIGFELGGNLCKAKGIAWFDKLELAQGSTDTSNKWKYACFIFENTNVKLENGKTVNEKITDREQANIKSMTEKFEKSMSGLSKSKMSAECEIIKISDPITTLSFDENNGYYVGEKDVYNQIIKNVGDNEYDHIFAFFKLPDEKYLGYGNVNDWIGLGNMEFCGIGFSDIRIYDGFYSANDDFPQEVLVHEFLHTLERNAEEYGYERPALHDFSNYGYEEKKNVRLKQWYSDYMNKEIKNKGEYIGLPSEIFNLKPVKKSDFNYSNGLEALDEPKTIMEKLNCVYKQVENLFIRKQEETVIQIVSS